MNMDEALYPFDSWVEFWHLWFVILGTPAPAEIATYHATVTGAETYPKLGHDLCISFCGCRMSKLNETC